MMTPKQLREKALSKIDSATVLLDGERYDDASYNVGYAAELTLKDAELARGLDELEAKFTNHDHQLAAVFDAIRQLMEPPPAPEKRGRIGFQVQPQNSDVPSSSKPRKTQSRRTNYR